MLYVLYCIQTHVIAGADEDDADEDDKLLCEQNEYHRVGCRSRYSVYMEFVQCTANRSTLLKRI